MLRVKHIYGENFSDWYIEYPGGLLKGPYASASFAQQMCDEANASIEKHQRESMALESMLSKGIAEAEIWDAIDKGELLRFEQADTPVVVDESPATGPSALREAYPAWHALKQLKS